jgi:hypothetical protein
MFHGDRSPRGVEGQPDHREEKKDREQMESALTIPDKSFRVWFSFVPGKQRSTHGQSSFSPRPPGENALVLAARQHMAC